MNPDHVRAYSFLLHQYIKRADGEIFPIRWKVFSDACGPAEDVRTPSDMLKDMAKGKFAYDCVWMCQRSANAVFPVGEHNTYEHTFSWIELHEDRFPGRRPGAEVCVIDFSKSLKIIQKEIEALWHRDKITDHASLGAICPNATERYLCSGLKSCSVSSARIVGLWLWDRVNWLGGTRKRGAVAQAIRDFEEDVYDLHALGLHDKGVSDFRDYFRWTNACVESWEVLPFSKR